MNALFWPHAMAKATLMKDKPAALPVAILTPSNPPSPLHHRAAPFATAPSTYPGKVTKACSVALTTLSAASSATKVQKYHEKSMAASAGRTAFSA